MVKENELCKEHFQGLQTAMQRVLLKANKRTSVATLLSTAQKENSNLVTIIFKDSHRHRGK